MPFIRVVFKFEQLGQTWSEGLLLNKGSSDLSTYKAPIDRLAAKMMALRGAETYLWGATISEEGVFRDGFFYNFDGGPIRGYQQFDSDSPANSLIVRCRNATWTRFKNIFLRGHWDTVVRNGGIYYPNVTSDGGSSFLARMQAYAAQLKADTWGWLGTKDRTYANITAVAANTDGTVNVTMQSGLFGAGPYVNTQVRISQVQGATQLNGLQLVTPLSATTFKTVHRFATLSYTTGGRVLLTNKDFIAIEDIATVKAKAGSRKPGRNFFATPGRRTVRRAS